MLLAGACNGGPEVAPSPSPAESPSSPLSPSPSPTPDEPVLQEVGEFDQPVYVTAAPGDPRLFVAEKPGRVKVIRDGEVKVFLDVSSQVRNAGEQGFFALAFAPDYSGSGLFYVHYSDRNGDTRVVEYRVSSDPDGADPASAREILFQDQPFGNHNGGMLLFDSQGMLILGLGDGGSGGDPANRAQNLGTLLGKLVRIDPRNPSGGRPYGIPSDNPFVGRAGARPEIWAYGLRNPWRFSFHAQTGDLYLGDVGQNRFEEVNWVPPDRQPGANYGWRAYEGRARFTQEQIDESRLVLPVHIYSLEGTPCTVVGGYLYRGQVNTLRGHYLYGDFCEGVVRSFRIQDGQAVGHRVLPLQVNGLASFGEDAQGELYVVSSALTAGGAPTGEPAKVFKIVPR